MKLAYSPISPFARKVRIAAIELGLADRITLEPMHLLPNERHDDYQQRVNPLGKIPVLTLDDGRVLYDSLVICEYLDVIAGGGRLLPAHGNARFDALTQHALANGMADALVLLRYENVLRPEALRWQDWCDGQLRKVHAGLAWFEQHADTLNHGIDLPQIALGCLLGYADFRFPQLGWQQAHPRLAAWYARIATRASFVDTAPSA